MSNATQAAQPLFHTNVIPINSELHGGLRFNRGAGYGYSAGAAIVPIGLDEFEPAAHSHPILFTDASPPVPVVLLGVRDGWNLYVNEMGAWKPGAFIPALVRAFPFAVLQDDAGTRLFGFEADAACVSPTTGLPLFEDGKPAGVLSEALAFCDSCEAGLRESLIFGAAVEQAGVLEPQSATIEVNGGGSVKIDGFKAVDRGRLAAMHDGTLLDWRRRGWLVPLYAHLFSAANWVPFTELATSQLAARR